MPQPFPAPVDQVFITPAALHQRLSEADAPGVVFVGDAADFNAAHLAGAAHLTYGDITQDAPPVHGLMPPADAVLARLTQAGVDPRQPLVAYDVGRRGQAARLVFTLDALGFAGTQVLDGGLVAWLDADLPVESGANEPQPLDAPLPARSYNHVALDGAAINALREATAVRLVDTRTAPEFDGRDVRAARGGHIPGAAHLEWTDLMDASGRLLDEDALRARLAAADVRPEHHAIVYCHSHHRSAHTYAVLRHLGYAQVSGYPGAWSDWATHAGWPTESAHA